VPYILGVIGVDVFPGLDWILRRGKEDKSGKMKGARWIGRNERGFHYE
jgi:hypothetical protein